MGVLLTAPAQFVDDTWIPQISKRAVCIYAFSLPFCALQDLFVWSNGTL